MTWILGRPAKGCSVSQPSHLTDGVIARPKHTNASVEACATLTPPFGTERIKMPCYLAPVKSMQNPAMKNHLLSIGNNRLAEACPLDPVWAIDHRADDPRANDPRQWRGTNLLGEALSAVRDAIRESEAGSAHPSSRRFCTPTGNAGVHEISSAPQPSPLSAASAFKGPPSEFSTCFPDAPADQSPDFFAIASGVGPCLVGGTAMLDDVSFTTTIAIHSKGDAMAPYRCVALLDTGSP